LRYFLIFHLHIDFIYSQNGIISPWNRSDDTEVNNSRARIAYQALFKVTARHPKTNEYSKFSTSVREIAENVFGVDYGHEEVSEILNTFSSCVLKMFYVL
jgi:hypothetical protein